MHYTQSFATSPFGVMSPARMIRSTSTAAQLAYASAPGSSVASLAQVEMPAWISEIPKSSADAYFLSAYWLAIGGQLAGGRNQAWTPILKEAWDAYKAGNLRGAGLDRVDERAAILRRGAEVAVMNNIPESASALTQLALQVEKKEARGKGRMGMILASAAAMIIFGGLALFYGERATRAKRTRMRLKTRPWRGRRR